jgi:pimeloyl-ACP methyl ester carboxylesterase
MGASYVWRTRRPQDVVGVGPMALVEVNTQDGALTGTATLAEALAALPADEPVVVMIHGYKFSPSCPQRSPHRHILGLAPDPSKRRAVSWPRHLRLNAAGLGIAFGWDSSGLLPGAYRRAADAGEALARLLALVEATRGAPAHVIAHSLGARVALAALPHLAPKSAGRMILMQPAELQGPALAALDSPAGRAAWIIAVTGRENDLFDALFEWGVAPLSRSLLSRQARSVGAGLVDAPPNWIELAIDRPEVLARLTALGHRIAPPARTVCHWSGYLRPGVFPLYRAIIDGRLPIATLRAALPAGPSRPWRRPTLARVAVA